MERWRKVTIPEYSDCYLVSNQGRVKSTLGNVLSQNKRDGVYLSVHLSNGKNGKNFMVHRLVSLAFLKKPKGENLVVNHIDCAKTNNNAENLEWITKSENSKHSYRTGRTAHTRGVKQYTLDGKFVAKFSSIKEASEKTDCCAKHIPSVCKGKRRQTGGYVWKYVKPDIFADESEFERLKDFPEYGISRDGRVYSYKSKMCQKLFKKENGYVVVTFSEKGKVTVPQIHRLVAAQFIPNDDPLNKTQVNHKDWNRSNNNVENLEWMTPSQNSSHHNKGV